MDEALPVRGLNWEQQSFSSLIYTLSQSYIAAALNFHQDQMQKHNRESAPETVNSDSISGRQTNDFSFLSIPA